LGSPPFFLRRRFAHSGESWPALRTDCGCVLFFPLFRKIAFTPPFFSRSPPRTIRPPPPQSPIQSGAPEPSDTFSRSCKKIASDDFSFLCPPTYNCGRKELALDLAVRHGFLAAPPFAFSFFSFFPRLSHAGCAAVCSFPFFRALFERSNGRRRHWFGEAPLSRQFPFLKLLLWVSAPPAFFFFFLSLAQDFPTVFFLAEAIFPLPGGPFC